MKLVPDYTRRDWLILALVLAALAWLLAGTLIR
jgi:hypothetical protein